MEQRAEQTIFELTIAGAVTPAAIARINDTCKRAEDAAPGACVVLRLRGNLEPGNDALRAIDIHLLTQWERAVRRLERIPAAIVAVAEGVCGWTECSVLMVADRRFAEPNLRLTLSDNRSSVLPGMTLHRIVNQVGSSTFRRMVLFGEELSADEAVAHGLLDELTADTDSALTAFLESIRNTDTTNIAVCRQLLLEAPARSFEDALGTHLAASDRLLRRAAAQQVS
jgi:isomerase DpgB